MRTLIFDTETSGFFNSKLNLDDPNQGRILQLACVLLDEEFQVVNSFYSLIKQENTVINPGAQAAHGISLEMCNQYGINMSSALRVFYDLYNSSDFRVAHNIAFDSRMLDTEMTLDDDGATLYNWNTPEHICTMRAMTDIIQLPGNGRYGSKFKWPKLQEAYYYCFSENFKDAHDAMADIKATSKIFKWLLDNKHVVLPSSLSC